MLQAPVRWPPVAGWCSPRVGAQSACIGSDLEGGPSPPEGDATSNLASADPRSPRLGAPPGKAHLGASATVQLPRGNLSCKFHVKIRFEPPSRFEGTPTMRSFAVHAEAH
jgi:hypothetical protein